MNLDREKAREVLWDWSDRGSVERLLDALERCVVEDPRLTAIAALCDARDRRAGDGPAGWIDTDDVRAVLGGGPA